MFYDLHIHSCLSPCAERDMTIHNILNMCMIKGLDVISVTDHNSLKQYKYLKEVARNYDIQLVFGVEVQTLEDIHVCCYFKDEENISDFQQLLDRWHPGIRNNSSIFGIQELLDSNDLVYKEEELLLIAPMNVGINELCEAVHSHRGSVVLAHAIHRSNSICTQLGFIPKELRFDGIEVRNQSDRIQIEALHPWIKDTVWLNNSDAHRLIDIHEAEFEISIEMFQRLWRNAI